MNLKNEIFSLLESIGYGHLNNLLTESIDASKGDFCLPCFSLSKTERKAPQMIAEDIASKLNLNNSNVTRVECVAGYINFFFDKEKIAKKILTEFKPNVQQPYNNKTICIDYCSVNLAKYMHIGHLKNCFLGESLARLFESAGYKVVRINYIGDYGTPYGKIIAGINMYGSEVDIEARGIDALQDYYVKFCAAEIDNEELQQKARDIFKKIELKDPSVYPTYLKIIEVARKEAERLLDILGIHFDSWKGEASYSEELDNVVDFLKSKNLITTSQGALVVNLDDYDMPPCLIKRSDGASLYATRDLAAALDRYNNYRFDKCIYLTAVEQKLHFAQFFKVLELAGTPFYSGLEHIAYGRFSLPSGKISSRHGKQAILVDLIDYVMDKAKDVIKDRTFSIEEPDNVAKKVAKGVLSFNALNIERHKDAIFDIERAFNFDGETAPYMQYTYTRIASILRKAPNISAQADYSCLDNEYAFDLIKKCCNINQAVNIALEKRDPSLLLKYIMDLCKSFNKFYSVSKILDGNDSTTIAKLQLMKTLKRCLEIGFHLICLDTLQEM